MATLGKREKSFLKKSEAEKLKVFREADQHARIYYLELLNQIRGPEAANKLAEKANYTDMWNANKGRGGGALPGTFGKGRKPSDIFYPTPEAKKVTEAKEQMLSYGTEGLKELLGQLKTPYTSPFNQQMEQMFGQLQNPIMQALLNPTMGNQAMGSLMPDDIQQEYQQLQQQQQQQNNPINQLMGALGEYGMQQHVLPWLQKPENWEQMYGYAEPGLNQMYQGAQNAYQGAGNAYGGIQNLLSNLVGGVQNYADRGYSEIRDPQTYGESIQKMVGGPMQPFVHPMNFAQGVGQIGRNAFNYMRGQ